MPSISRKGYSSWFTDSHLLTVPTGIGRSCGLGVWKMLWCWGWIGEELWSPHWVGEELWSPHWVGKSFGLHIELGRSCGLRVGEELWFRGWGRAVALNVRLEPPAHPCMLWKTPSPSLQTLLPRKSLNKGNTPKSPVQHSWWLLQLPPLKLPAIQVPA